MTNVCTEDTLKALNKTQLIDLFLKMEDQINFTIDSLMTETKGLNNSFKRLESDVKFKQTRNNNFLKQLENTERQCWANAQYSSCEYIEVICIPKTIESKDLEHTGCKIFNRIGFDTGEDRIDACHQLNMDVQKFNNSL